MVLPTFPPLGRLRRAREAWWHGAGTGSGCCAAKSLGFSFPVLAAQLPKATMDTLVGRFRAYCMHTSIHKAYEPYWGPPITEGYNRPATAHAAGPTQITLANALAAVMLVVGLVRELEETQRPLSPAG